MRLVDLFQQIPLLEDYGRLPEPPNNLPSFDPKFAKVVGTFDSREIWGSRELKGYEIYGIKDDKQVIAYVIIEERALPGHLHKLRELWVSASYRGKGVGIGILAFLLRKLGLKLKLAHDEIVSADARKFIMSALRQGVFKARWRVMPAKNYRYLRIDQLDKVFNSITKDDIELILEGTPVPYPLFGIGSKILSEHWYVRDRGLD